MLKPLQAITVILFLIISVELSAQKKVLNYHYSNPSLEPTFSSIFSKQNFKDSSAVISFLTAKIDDLHEIGYIESAIDSIKFNRNKVDVYIYTGREFKSLDIRYDRRFEELLLAVNSKYLSTNFRDLGAISDENRKITTYLENHAYPFAKVKLDSVDIQGSNASAFLNIDRGERTVYDTIRIKGNLKVSKSFLYGYTGLKPNNPYNHKKVLNLKKKINDLPFAQQNKEAELIYKDKKVSVNIPAYTQKNNRFDGILGILPNDETTGKLVLTGEINIFLQNMLRSAEQISFKWQKLESSSQKLKGDFKVPYIFNTKLGLSANIDLLKQDSTYLNSILGLGTQFYFSGQNNIGLHYKSKSSSILSKDSVIQTQFKAYHISSTGLSFNYKQLDYYFNPHRGVDVSLLSGIGKKDVKNEADNNSGTKTTFVQYDASLVLKWYIKLASRHTLLLSNQSATLISESLFKNELYQIGGLKSIRGFMESSIYASTYSIVSAEYRFIFEKNSAMFLFFDGAWYEKKLETYYYDYPIGFGFGLFFKTKAGIFTISYAMGQQRNEHANIKNAKIHFGFINKF